MTATLSQNLGKKIVILLCMSTFCLLLGRFAHAELQPLLIETSKGQVILQVEIAKDAQTRTKGLMHRQFLAPNQGMLFVYPDSRRRQFWMKETLIPLDILFIDQAGKVINIEQGIPQTLERLKSAGPARYVLEINQGLAKKWGIATGNQITVPAID